MYHCILKNYQFSLYLVIIEFLVFISELGNFFKINIQNL